MDLAVFQEGSLCIDSQHRVTISEIEKKIHEFCLLDKVEGWLCYTSSIWLKRSDRDIQQLDFISGSADDKGILLQAEFSKKTENKYITLHIRSNAGHYSWYLFTIEFTAGIMGAERVQIVQESFFCAISQEIFPQWKAKYANCWMLEKVGITPHDIQVWQPQIGVFLGFEKGE